MPNAAALNDEDWQASVIAVVLAARMLSQHDIPALLRAAEHVSVIGPLLYPTLYREKGSALEEDVEMLRAALPLWELAQRLGGKDRA